MSQCCPRKAQISFASSVVPWTGDKANYRHWQRVECVEFSYRHQSLLSCDPKKTSAIEATLAGLHSPSSLSSILSLFRDLLAFVCQRKHSGLSFKFFHRENLIKNFSCHVFPLSHDATIYINNSRVQRGPAEPLINFLFPIT